MDAGDIVGLLWVAYAIYCWAYQRGEAAAEKRYATQIRLGQWLSKAVADVRDTQRFTGPGCIATNRGRATLSNGETYTVTIEMERR